MKVGKRTAKLLREAMVLAFVEGARWGEYHGKDEEFPKDSSIVARVLEASVSMSDLYPTLSKTEDAQAADEERRRRQMQLLSALVQRGDR